MIEVERERRRWNMGVYLNPGNEKFAKAVQSEIYVDKTGLIEYTNQVINTVQRYVCVSRPRRFGKSMTADMLFQKEKSVPALHHHIFSSGTQSVPHGSSHVFPAQPVQNQTHRCWFLPAQESFWRDP